MDTKKVQNTYQAIMQQIKSCNLRQAFDGLMVLDNELQNWTLHERLENLLQSYRFMLQYYIAGTEDPERIRVYNNLISKLFLLNEEFREMMLMKVSANFEYSKKRFFPRARKFPDPKKLLEAIRNNQSQTAILAHDGAHETELTRLRAEYEKLLPEIFDIFWLSTRFVEDEKQLFEQIMDEKHDATPEKALITSALILNIWRMFDEEKLLMLCDCCESNKNEVKQRAFVGLCFVLTKYDHYLTFFPMLRNRLVLLTDKDDNIDNFRNIIMQIIGTTETEKISRKLHDEILPELMKIAPKLKDKMNVEDTLMSDDWEEENPMWQDMIEESGVSDKLQELSELQLSGADVYMSTFAMLKSFPFFAEFSNWFMPFDTQHSGIRKLFTSTEKNFFTAISSSHVMCNSDLYSFCLSIAQMPENQQNMLKQGFKAESEQLDEMKKDESLFTPNLAAKNISKQYVQDLFRFFKIFPHRQDFADMFGASLHIHKTYLFNLLSADAVFKNDIAEYYFSKNLYPQALELYSELLDETEPSAALYQKIGYAHQKTSHLDEALKAYLKADMIQPDDIWTVKKIALCYRLQGDYEKSLEYYKHADFLQPHQFSTQMQIANAYLQIGKIKEALKIYYDLEVKNENNIKVQRAIVWVSFLAGNWKEAEYYSQKILEEKPLATDYLNAGHIAWCVGNRKAAADHYRKSLELSQQNTQSFEQSLKEDFVYLKNKGIDADELALMKDAVLFEI